MNLYEFQGNLGQKKRRDHPQEMEEGSPLCYNLTGVSREKVSLS